MKRKRNYGIVFSAATIACIILAFLYQSLDWALMGVIISQAELAYFVILYRLDRKAFL